MGKFILCHSLSCFVFSLFSFPLSWCRTPSGVCEKSPHPCIPCTSPWGLSKSECTISAPPHGNTISALPIPCVRPGPAYVGTSDEPSICGAVSLTASPPFPSPYHSRTTAVPLRTCTFGPFTCVLRSKCLTHRTLLLASALRLALKYNLTIHYSAVIIIRQTSAYLRYRIYTLRYHITCYY